MPGDTYGRVIAHFMLGVHNRTEIAIGEPNHPQPDAISGTFHAPRAQGVEE
jgi:hypothetical protein